MSSQQAIYDDQTMESILSDSMAARRFAMILLGAFAALALGLASCGHLWRGCVCGGTAYAGDRDSHGAGRASTGRATHGAVAGHTAGFVGCRHRARGRTHSCSPDTRGLLYGVSATDPVTFAGRGNPADCDRACGLLGSPHGEPCG